MGDIGLLAIHFIRCFAYVIFTNDFNIFSPVQIGYQYFEAQTQYVISFEYRFEY